MEDDYEEIDKSKNFFSSANQCVSENVISKELSPAALEKHKAVNILDYLQS